MEFSINDKNKIKRNPKRASYNKDIIYGIIDEALICHISFNLDNQPFIIPTIHVRDNDTIYFHGASTSRLIKHIENGNNMAVAFTHLDGIVLARSAFHHSMNYRSAIVFGKGRTCDKNESRKVFELLTEKLIPDRWKDARRPTDKEIKATSITAIDIEDASAKIRSGGPIDEDEDYNLDVWAGEIPVKQIYETPVPDEKLRDGIAIPDYLKQFSQVANPELSEIPLTKNKPIIIAHRGASFDAPENTLAAIKLAWEQDADAVEVDVQLSRDNKMVVIHDFNTKRVGNKNSLVKTQTLNELRKLDVGSWKDSKWSGEKIPQLNEVLSTVPGNKKLIVEIKCGNEIISELVSTVEQMEIETDQIEFISFDLSVCIAIKNVLPAYRVLLLSEMDYTWLQRIFRPSIDRLINVALKHNLDGLDLWSGNLIDANLIRKCVANNLLLYTWTINSPEKAKELISLGVDGITTDLPGQFKELISDLY